MNNNALKQIDIADARDACMLNMFLKSYIRSQTIIIEAGQGISIIAALSEHDVGK